MTVEYVVGYMRAREVTGGWLINMTTCPAADFKVFILKEIVMTIVVAGNIEGHIAKHGHSDTAAEPAAHTSQDASGVAHRYFDGGREVVDHGCGRVFDVG